MNAKDSLRRTGIVRDPRYREHDTGPGHPECPERLAVLDEVLDDAALSGLFADIPARAVSKEILLAVHSADYVARLQQTEGVDCTFLDPDTQASACSHEAALLAAGGFCRAVALVHAGKHPNAFALVRPPGHHAERSGAKGFCLYNNVAIGARYALDELHLRRVLIADWDLHHGNGTQHAFERDPSILYVSLHQRHLFPGTGKFRETGKGKGKGFTLNIPIPAGFGNGEYLTLFKKILRPVALEFNPEILLVSAGFDIHFADPLGGMRVTPKGFAAMTRVLMDIADHCCLGKLVLALEGGYDLTALRESVRAVLLELAGATRTGAGDFLLDYDREGVHHVVRRVRRVHRNFWKSLSAPDVEEFADLAGKTVPPRSWIGRFLGRISTLYR